MQRMHERHRVAISRLQAISELAPERREAIIERAQVLSFSPRTFVFKKGDDDPRALFVLQGRVDLVCDGQLIKTVEAGTPAAARPLAKVTPRRLGAIARTAAVVAVLDADAIAAAPSEIAPAGRGTTLEVAEIAQNQAGDWMTRLLQSRLLARLPAANIQEIFARMEPLELERGETVVRQGDPGEHFYVVREGRCVVTRHPAGDEGSTIKLAELGEGDSFGEEALVTGGRRGATVRMLSAGVVMRLAKEDFERLIRVPCTVALDPAAAVARVERGAVWLDVRPEDAGAHPVPGDAVSVPMSSLPMRVQRLDAKRAYVVVCDTGELAATAAFLLAQSGLDAAFLSGGLARLSGAPAAPEPPAPARGASAASASRTQPEPSPATAQGSAAAPVGPASRRPKPSADKARLEAARRALERRVQSERARLAERERESERRLTAALILKERAEAERETLSRNLADSLRSSREQLEGESARTDAALAEVERLKAEVDSARRVAARERGVKEARERELENLRRRAEARFAQEEARIREEQRRHAVELTELRSRREELEGELESVRGRLEAAEDGRRVAQAQREQAERQAAATPAPDPNEFTRTREELKRALAAERAQVRAERERLESQANRLQSLLDEVRTMREESETCGSRTRARPPAASDAPRAPSVERLPPPEVPESVHGHTEFDENRVLAREVLASIKRPRDGEEESEDTERRHAG